MLSRIREFDVVSRNTAFTYKDKALDLREVSENLNTRFLVEGSVRKAGSRVRVNAQLIDGLTGNHIWADRYDRELDDIFLIQDEIMNEIVLALQVELTEGEQVRLRRGQTNSVAAWELFVRSMSEHRRSTRQGMTNARKLLEEAVALDTEFVAAWVMLGRSHWQDSRAFGSVAPMAALDRAAQCVENSLAIDGNVPPTVEIRSAGIAG